MTDDGRGSESTLDIEDIAAGAPIDNHLVQAVVVNGGLGAAAGDAAGRDGPGGRGNVIAVMHG